VTGEGGERLVRDEQRRATGRPRRAGRGEAARGERRAVGEQRRPRRSWVETGELPGPVVGDDAVRRPQDAPAGVEAFGGGVTAPETWADELTGGRGVRAGGDIGVGLRKHGRALAHRAAWLRGPSGAAHGPLGALRVAALFARAGLRLGGEGDQARVEQPPLVRVGTARRALGQW